MTEANVKRRKSVSPMVERSAHADRSTLMMAKTNAKVQAISACARESLCAKNELGQSDLCRSDAVSPSGQTHQLALAAGDHIRYLARKDELGVIHGTAGRVLDVTTDLTGTLIVRAKVEGRAQLAHACATTSCGSQGLTTDQSFLISDTSMDRHDILVVACRHRHGLEVFFDATEPDTGAKAARLLTDRERPVQDGERHVLLAQILSRSGTRASTPDYLRPCALEHVQVPDQGAHKACQISAARAALGLSHER
ncbi:hypothetical protein V6617_14810 [Pelagibacterium nitratireducens]|uniref:Hedgehog/Intein (Hint) domain-containing protein n=2 Tax=Pelagibacterium TaxID=1082930 RepID=A0ABZ2I047_9HYPH